MQHRLQYKLFTPSTLSSKITGTVHLPHYCQVFVELELEGQSACPLRSHKRDTTRVMSKVLAFNKNTYLLHVYKRTLFVCMKP